MQTHSTLKKTARILLGTFLITTGAGHLTFSRKDFQAQVPNWVPLKKDKTVLYSGIAEIVLGSFLILKDKKQKTIGKIAAVFLQLFSRETLRNTNIIAKPLALTQITSV